MTDPFDANGIEETLSDVVKNLECRWGLTLASFLPLPAKDMIEKLQLRVSDVCTHQNDSKLCAGRKFINFYAFKNCHCTHLTFTRSDATGPVKKKSIEKHSRGLSKLFQLLNQLTTDMSPIEIKLGRIRLSRDKLGIVLTGNCQGDESLHTRKALLTALNAALPNYLNIRMRTWDSDTSQFGKLHCAIGYIKRPPPHGFDSFRRQVNQILFDPIQLTLSDIAVIHHRYRSLAFPQEGMVSFQFGQLPLTITERDFIDSLNLG